MLTLPGVIGADQQLASSESPEADKTDSNGVEELATGVKGTEKGLLWHQQSRHYHNYYYPLSPIEQF
jgi:hypothetical protein